MGKAASQEKKEIQQARDRLLDALVELAMTVCGCTGDGETVEPDMSTHRIMLEGLAATAAKSGEAEINDGVLSRRLERLRRRTAKENRRLASAGRNDEGRQDTGRNQKPVLAGRNNEPDIRSLKGEILANSRKAAAAAWSACGNGIIDGQVCSEFYPALLAVDTSDLGKELTRTLRESESLLKTCRVLEEKGIQKRVNEKFMREAIRQARKAEALGEVPIGCVIVRDGQIIGRGYNRRTTDKDVLAHAEVIAIHKACRKLGDWRLEGCTLYVTLEPCPMCAGAMVQSRLDACVIGSMSDKSGCAGSVINLLEEKGFNHQVRVISGVLREECSGMLSRFFERMRRERQR